MLQFHTFSQTNHGRTLLEMLGVLAIVGILSIAALVGFTYAMNKHRANETIYDVMLRGTNVPMVDENYASKPSGHEFTFPDLPSGTYYPMVTKKDSGSSYYVEATGVTYRVCEMILKMNPTDIDQIVVNNSVYTGDSDICGTTDGLAMKFCFGEDGTICNGTGGGGSGSGSGSGTEDPCDGIDCGSHGVCNNGVCDCTNGYKGVHCEMPPVCTADEDCADGEVCTNYECICPPLDTPTECQEITSVEDGCDEITNASDGKACTTSDNQNGVCISGVCELQCTPDCDETACQTCINGQCTYTCDSGESCYKGQCMQCEKNPTSKTCDSDQTSDLITVDVQGGTTSEKTTCCQACSGEAQPEAYYDGSSAVCCYGKVNQKEDGSFICCPSDKPYWAPTYFKYTGVGQIEKSNWACSACPESEMYFTADERNNAKYGECACPSGQHAITIGNYKNICCSETVEGFYLWDDYYPQCCSTSQPNSVFDQNGSPQCCGSDQRYWAPRYFKYTGVNEIEKSDWGCSACPESEMYFTADDSNNAKRGECACPDGQHAVTVGDYKNICCSNDVEGFYLWGDYYPQCCYSSSPNVVYDSNGVAHCCASDQRYWVPRYFKYTGVNEIEKSDWGCSACPESEMYFTADERNNAKYGECACPDGQRAVSTEYASRICCSEKVEGFYLWGGYYPQCCYESTPKLFNGPSGVQCCRTDAVGVDKNGNCCNPPDKLIGSTCCGEDATGLDEDGNCEY